MISVSSMMRIPIDLGRMDVRFKIKIRINNVWAWLGLGARRVESHSLHYLRKAWVIASVLLISRENICADKKCKLNTRISQLIISGGGLSMVDFSFDLLFTNCTVQSNASRS